jgi:UTP-glucose-1-phosphate uridylyltransferase/mevalonate kinase
MTSVVDEQVSPPNSPRQNSAHTVELKSTIGNGRNSGAGGGIKNAEAHYLFVPGRVCLFGEHSDWAGGFRRFNPSIQPGCTLVVGTNQGLHAECWKHPSSLILRSTDESGKTYGPHEIPMEKSMLLAAAKKGDFWSYAAGVAYKLLTDYRISGIVINNYKTDLPLKKGLSSSAAVCVLTARALNRVYDLKMTTRGEMEYAYQGEILTPSMCGRMDQACAFGSRPVSMVYDGEFLAVSEIRVPKPLYYSIVDLKAKKDTVVILRDLQSAYPKAQTKEQEDVQNVLGPINLDITSRASIAFSKGDAKALGELMNEAQVHFDRAGQGVCPSQLTAPVLHKILEYPKIQNLVWGGKGVGAGGDGTAQFICKNEEAQDEVKKILEKDLKVEVMNLVIEASSNIKKALIPAAGFGIGLFPATKSICPALFPIVDDDGIAKPAILIVVQELVDGGIEEIIIVVQPNDLAAYEDFFKKPLPAQNYARLNQQQKLMAKNILRLGEKVKLVVQPKQEGFGNAVLCAKDAIGKDAFLLVLGDHLYKSKHEHKHPCVQQILECHKEYCSDGSALVGLQKSPGSVISHFGAATGTWLSRSSNANNNSGSSEPNILKISAIREKPSLDEARALLKVPGYDDDSFLTVFGYYIIPPIVFEHLQKQHDNNLRGTNGQFGFTDVLRNVMNEVGAKGLVMEGERFDLGTPEHFLRTTRNWNMDV